MAKTEWFESVQLFRTKRKNVGLTQHQLAKISKIDRAVIADIEAGRRKLTNDKVGEALWGALTLTEARRSKEAFPLTVLNQTPSEFGSRLLSVPRGALHAALTELPPTEQGSEQRECLSEQEVERGAQLAQSEFYARIYRFKNRSYRVVLAENGRIIYHGSAETESRSEAEKFLAEKIIDIYLKSTESIGAEARTVLAGEVIEKLREHRIERKRQLAALENLQSIDDPIISELIESFRREIAEKDKQLEEMSRTLVKNGRTATT
jgi:transcriptional regulator with XRE-family HTH domain